jgi:hypothetical protein
MRPLWRQENSIGSFPTNRPNHMDIYEWLTKVVRIMGIRLTASFASKYPGH